MIITNITGGLGNQMFQYALGKVISLEKNTELLLQIKDTHNNQHNGFELKRVFDIKNKVAKRSDLKKVLGFRANPWIMRRMRSIKWLRGNCYFCEPHYYYTDAVFNIPSNAFIQGYWQSEKYFIKYKNEILKDYSFSKNISQVNKDIIKRIKAHTSISIHVRRGDYLSVNAMVMDVDYYNKAISCLNITEQNILYVIFSDDFGWVEACLLDLLEDHKYIMVTHNSGDQSYNDMMLMSLCDHNIIANSSFSWWGAWLNINPSKKVIAPKKWSATIDINAKHSHPDKWISI